MKVYLSPEVAVYGIEQDVLTSSDNALGDIFFEKKNTENSL